MRLEMDPRKELQLLTSIEDQDRFAMMVKIVCEKGSSICYILGPGEKLATNKLEFTVVKGVKYFQVEGIRSLFTGIMICREIYSPGDEVAL